MTRQNSTPQALDMEGDGVSATRPDDLSESDPLIQGAAAGADSLAPSPTTDVQAFGITDTVAYCPEIAFKLAKAKAQALLNGDDADVKRYQEELRVQFGGCDPRWLECIEEYLSLLPKAEKPPYRGPNHPGYPFVIDGRLPTDAKIALVADWGTGQDGARKLLEKLKT